MLLSDEKSFVFIHVPKAGGTSVTEALRQFALPRPPRWTSLLRPFGLPRDHRRHRFEKHGSLRSVERVLPGDRFRTWFKFAFVRNPWDRLVSDYSFVLNRPAHRRHARVKRLGSFAAYLEREAPRVMSSQVELLRDSTGRVGVDFVGRFERLEADFATVCARIGVAARLAHHNRTDHAAYREFYDERTRDLVRSSWADDVEAFGYEF